MFLLAAAHPSLCSQSRSSLSLFSHGHNSDWWKTPTSSSSSRVVFAKKPLDLVVVPQSTKRRHHLRRRHQQNESVLLLPGRSNAAENIADVAAETPTTTTVASNSTDPNRQTNSTAENSPILARSNNLNSSSSSSSSSSSTTERHDNNSQMPIPSDNETNSAAADDESVLFESPFYRHELATYLFSEFYHKNLSASLDTNSPAQVVPVAVHPNEQQPAPGPQSHTSGRGSGPAAGAEAGAGNSGSVMAADGSASSTSQVHVPTQAITTSAAAAGNVYSGGAAAAASNSLSAHRPYFGDVFYSFQMVYWPIHCVICLAICTLGIFANLTNIIVLTRPNMITAVNTILSAMAFTDLIVNVSNIPYLMHELSDSTNVNSFYSFPWAVYILFHAHTTVTAHTISIWLTCVLATWRYFVVCRSQASGQRNWSVGLAKRAILGVFLFVPIFCIPNYLSFAIVREITETNNTIYKVGFSHLADESDFIKTFHFWIFSCLTKLVPCVLLTFFTTVLIRKLLKTRERRLRLATYGTGVPQHEIAHKEQLPGGGGGGGHGAAGAGDHELGKLAMPNGDTSLPASKHQKQSPSNVQNQNHHRGRVGSGGGGGESFAPPLIDNSNHFAATSGATVADHSRQQQQQQQQRQREHQTSHSNNHSRSPINQAAGTERSGESQGTTAGGSSGLVLVDRAKNTARAIQLGPQSNSSGACTTETEVLATSCASGLSGGATATNGPPSGLVFSFAANSSELTPSAVANNHQDDNDGNQNKQKQQQRPKVIMSQLTVESAEGSNSHHRTTTSISLTTAPTKMCACDTTSKQQNADHSQIGTARSGGADKRSMGSTTLAPFQIIKLQAAQRQLNQNETTTRLLIAVMIVFLICEFPAGILAALCAILGQDFFENVYQPTGTLTDLLALINSSVNFILYCFMSTQFRITFYRVVLHCPAPNVPQNHQQHNHNNHQPDNERDNEARRQSARKSTLLPA